jgi:hypothetical protein
MENHYNKLTKQDFDAIVTGELTHYSLCMEDEVNEFILDYFLKGTGRRNEFRSIFFERECLTFQNKLDILKATFKQHAPAYLAQTLKLIGRVESFKSLRNAFAHGNDWDDSKDLRIEIQVTSRAGKKKSIIVTPQTHQKTVDEGEALLKDLQTWRVKMINEIKKNS